MRIENLRIKYYLVAGNHIEITLCTEYVNDKLGGTE